MGAKRSATQVLAGLGTVRSWQEDFYRDLHAHPELSHQEHRTAAAIAERLRHAGFDVYEGVGGTGVVGILTNGDGPRVLLRADGRAQWSGSVVAVFQPAEEVGDGAHGMVTDGLADLVGTPDVAFAQHVLPYPSVTLGTHSGPFLSAADSMRITVYGQGAHGSMPQAAVDPVMLAAMIVIRLQTIVSRELPRTSSQWLPSAACMRDRRPTSSTITPSSI